MFTNTYKMLFKDLEYKFDNNYNSYVLRFTLKQNAYIILNNCKPQNNNYLSTNMKLKLILI